MKSCLVCLLALAACSGNAGADADPPAPAAQSEVYLPPNDEPSASPCDQPLRYGEVTVDGQQVRVPIFVACDPFAPKRDLGDPPPDEAAVERSLPVLER